MMLGFTLLYGILQNLLTYAVLPYEPRLVKVLILRVGCTCFQLLILIVALVSNYLMRNNMIVQYPSQIQPGVPAFTEQIVLDSTEWLAVASIMVYLCSFYAEFQNLELSLNGLSPSQVEEDGDEFEYGEKAKLLEG